MKLSGNKMIFTLRTVINITVTMIMIDAQSVYQTIPSFELLSKLFRMK